jgi:hypothetical protein
MSLTTAIDEALDYLRAHPEEMTRDELDEFRDLAEAVYIGAVQAGFAGALPQVPEMKPALESQEPVLPPVQFETKLNLPGDWDPVIGRDDGEDDLLRHDYSPVVGDEPCPVKRVNTFLVSAPPRWFHDMATLRKLAEAKEPWADKIETSPTARGSESPPRLTIDLAKREVILEGERIDVNSEQALRWIKVLAEHSGEFISSCQLQEYDPNLINIRTDKLKAFLPPKILALIDSQTGAGSRIRFKT